MAYRAHLIAAVYYVLSVGVRFNAGRGSACALNVLPLSLCGVARDAHGRQIAQGILATIAQRHRVVYLIRGGQELPAVRAPPTLSSCHYLLLRLCNTPTHASIITFIVLYIDEHRQARKVSRALAYVCH